MDISYLYLEAVMDKTDTTSRGQGSSKPLLTEPVGAPKFHLRMPENNVERTPDNNITQVNLGNTPLNLAQLS